MAHLGRRRSYIPSVDDPALSCRRDAPAGDAALYRRRLARRRHHRQRLDDRERRRPRQVESFIYAKVSLGRPDGCCVPRTRPSEARRPRRQARSRPRWSASRASSPSAKSKWMSNSHGAPPRPRRRGLVDAVVEVTETGSSLRANGSQHRRGTADLDAGAGREPDRWNDEWKQAKIKQIAVLMRGALDAESRVGIKMNVARRISTR